MPQGEYVAESLKNYLERHPQMEQCISKGASVRYFTTESPERFEEQARVFLHEPVQVEKVTLE